MDRRGKTALGVDGPAFPRISSQSRICVVGTSGAGKSTLARRLTRLYGLYDIELDALYWEPGWVAAAPETFEARVRAEMARATGWVIHGNYRRVQELTMGAADMIVWLNYRRPLVMWRVMNRTLRRIVNKERLWNGKRETWRGSLLSKDSVILWAWQTHENRRRQYARLRERYPDKVVVELRCPGDAKALFASPPGEDPDSLRRQGAAAGSRRLSDEEVEDLRNRRFL